MFKKILHKTKGFPIAVALVLALTMAVGGTVAYIVTATNPVRNKFTSGLEATGNIAITKQVKHPYGDGYEIPATLEFTFTVNVGAENAGENFDGYTADKDGNITVTLGANETKIIKGIPKDTAVTVSETNVPAGFTAPEAETVTIRAAETKSVIAVNQYAPSPAETDYEIQGTKTLEGRAWTTEDRFTFALERSVDGNWTKIAEKTITPEFDATGAVKQESTQFDFTDALQGCSFDRAGTYSFRVSEIKGEAGGITYDETSSLFDVTVTDTDMDGALEIADVTTVSSNTTIQDKVITMNFVNRYAPSGSTDVTIEIEKEMKDASGSGKLPAGYCFELRNESGAVIATSDPTNAEGKSSLRLVYTPEDVDHIYIYTLKEKTGSEAGMQYDTKEYKLMVHVIDMLDGTVSADISEYSKAAYDALLQGASSTVQQPRTTVYAGAAPEDEEPAAEEGSDTTVTQTEEAVPQTDDIASDSASGQTEQINKNNKWRGFSNSPDERTEETELQEEEQVQVKAKTAKEGNRSFTAHFTNTYNPEAVSFTLEGVKELDGRTLKEGEFSFVLYSCDASFVRSALMGSSTNHADGTFAFYPLWFDQPGTYYYTVSEENTGITGITYDDTIYRIVITVSDQGGVLKATAAYTKDSSDSETILFRNAYTPEPASYVLSGNKTLTGKELEAEEFTFDLYPADRHFNATGAAVQSAANKEDGTFTFNTLKFGAPGNYQYIVKENTGKHEPGIAYDEHVFGVRIRVWDEGTGTLLCNAEILDAETGMTRDALSFHNVYSQDFATIGLTGLKTLEGGKLSKGMFSFELYKADENGKAIGSAIDRVSNEASGKIEFNTMTFDQEGTYRYLIKEDASAQQEHVTYDTTEYIAEITVTKEDNIFHAATIITKAGSNQEAELVFHNKWTEENKEQESKGSSGGSQKWQKGNSQTGDRNIVLYSTIIFGGAALLLAMLIVWLIYDKKRNNNKKK